MQTTVLFVLLGLAACSSALPRNSREFQLIEYLQNNNRDIDESLLEDASLNTLQLIAKYGYQGELHTVQTEDGYILNIHRILPNSKCTTNKGPVILQHGLLSSSADWVLMGPQSGFGYLLSDACYDVWMGNSRGNTWSRNHTRLDPNGAEYWDFSWHEMALYDLPTLIDYVLYRTGYKNLYYVGHSQGTTQFFIFNALKPEYHSKVKAMFALAPIAFMGNAHASIIKFIANFLGVGEWIAANLGIYQLLPSSDFIAQIGGTLCNDEHPNSQNVCTNLLFAMCGYDEEQTNKTMLPVVLAHTPAGSSTKQFLHYGQLMNSGAFQQYDYGKKENQLRYGQKTPPDYPLENTGIPTALYYSHNDYFAAEEDVNILFSKLNSVIGKFLVPWEQFNHLDYMWAINAPEWVYQPVIETMDRQALSN